MIDRVVNLLFGWGRLREAIFEEVHLYDYLDKIMKDPESMSTASTFWPDIDGWRGWHHSQDTGKYYFNDIPEDTAMNAIEMLNNMEYPSQPEYIV